MFQALVFGFLALACWRLLRRFFLRTVLDNVPGPSPSSFWAGERLNPPISLSVVHNTSWTQGSLRDLHNPRAWDFHQKITETCWSAVRCLPIHYLIYTLDGGVVRMKGSFGHVHFAAEMDLPIAFDSLTNEWLPFLATRLWQMVLFHTTSTVSCKPEFQNLHMGAGVLLTTIQVIWNSRRNWWRSWILGYTNIKPENLFFDAKGHLKVCSAAVTSHPFVTAYWFPPHRLVIMEHLRYIVDQADKSSIPVTCLS
jgi:hypothetical protein